ncbi:caspase family protein [Acidovorax sp. ACV02]|uniref:caspase family protein n=1 Tax=Acidovorax sp. ACV02 TaxID=2769310 RepID=UPI0017862632|nr:caspase family protein [Acidovorax sp. ACV02]MBD9404392.1 caspase family protein [Acidovorax sp. ACV02]
MTTPGFPQGHALLIGVTDYRFVTNLPIAVRNDVLDLSRTLSAQDLCGYDPVNVVALLDAQATRVAVMEALEDLASRVGAEDTACVYFSGHGAVLDEATYEDSFLLTVDSDPEELPTTAISSDEFSSALMKVKAKRLLVFVDACHAGGTAISKGVGDGQTPYLKSGYSEKTFAKLANGSGRALMASCRASEESSIFPDARNSVFTTALLEGLRGSADPTASGFVRVFDLFGYVADQVPQVISEQHPVFHADQIEGNFPVALSRGGKNSPGNGPSLTSTGPQNWKALEEALVDLYPSGPRDQEVWSRAGGDLSRLAFQANGRVAWHAALRTLQQGGGGRNITFASLLEVAKDDFENNAELMKLEA